MVEKSNTIVIFINFKIRLALFDKLASLTIVVVTQDEILLNCDDILLRMNLERTSSFSFAHAQQINSNGFTC